MTYYIMTLTESQKVGCCMEWPCYRQSSCGNYTTSSSDCDLFMKDYCIEHRGPASAGSWPQECRCLAAELQYVTPAGNYITDPVPTDPKNRFKQTVSEYTYAHASPSMKSQWPYYGSPSADPYCGIQDCSRSHTSYVPSKHRYSDTGCPSKVCFSMVDAHGHDNHIITSLQGGICGGPGEAPDRRNTFGNPPAPSKTKFYLKDFIKFLTTFWPILMVIEIIIFALIWELLPVPNKTPSTLGDADTHTH